MTAAPYISSRGLVLWSALALVSLFNAVTGCTRGLMVGAFRSQTDGEVEEGGRDSAVSEVPVDIPVTNVELPDAALDISETLVAKLTVDPANADFGRVVVGATSMVATFQVINQGQAPSEMLSVAVGSMPSDFVIHADGCKGQILAPNGACAVEVWFAPAVPGIQGESLIVRSRSGDVVVGLSGTGLPALSFNPAQLDFGCGQNDLVGRFSGLPQTVILTNNTPNALSALAVTITGTDMASFQLSPKPPCPSTLNAGATCKMVVTFAPTTCNGACPGAPYGATLTAQVGRFPQFWTAPLTGSLACN